MHMGLWDDYTMFFTKKATEAEKLYYPGGCRRMFIINTPMLFKMIWPLAKSWIDEKTRSRITLCGQNHLE